MLSAAVSAAAVPLGGADPTFGQGGRVTFGLPVSRNDYAGAVAVGADGRVFVGATSGIGSGGYDDFDGSVTAFAALTAAGKPDRAFAGDGLATVRPGDGFEGVAPSVVRPVAGGKFLAVLATSERVAVARVGADGQLDPTFGGGGVVRVDGYRANLTSSRFAVTADGGFLVGDTYGYAPLERFAADGHLVGTFGPTGLSSASVLAVQPDGKVLVGTQADGLRRLLADGSADPSFAGGKAVSLAGAAGPAASLDQLLPTASGKVLVTFRADDDPAATLRVRRYNADGTPDATFAGGKALDTGVRPIALLDLGSTYPTYVAPRAVAQPGGGLALLGATTATGGPAVVRVTPAGKRDAAFGTRKLPAGLLSADLAAGPGGSTVVVATRPSPAPVQGGNAAPAGTTYADVIVLRLKADGSTDGGFGAKGQAVVDVKTDYATATASAAAPGGKLVVVGRLGG